MIDILNKYVMYIGVLVGRGEGRVVKFDYSKLQSYQQINEMALFCCGVELLK